MERRRHLGIFMRTGHSMMGSIDSLEENSRKNIINAGIREIRE
jgi:hypothetical protein